MYVTRLILYSLRLQAPRPEVVLVVSRWKTDGQSMHASTPIEDPLVATFKNTLRPPRIPEVATDCDTKNCLSTISFQFPLIISAH